MKDITIKIVRWTKHSITTIYIEDIFNIDVLKVLSAKLLSF